MSATNWYWRGPGPRQLPESVVDDYRNGMTVNEIARRTGTGQVTIRRFLKEHGVVFQRGRLPGRTPGGNWWTQRHRGSMRQFDDRVIEDYERGMSIEDLAERENASHVTIRRFLRQRGVKMLPRAASPWHAQRIVPEDAIAMLVAGKRLREIAEHYGVHVDTVRSVLTEAGVEFRGGAGS
jgi:transposase